MSNKKHIIPEYDPKRKQEVQNFQIDQACTLVDLLMSILLHCKGAKVRAGAGVNKDGDPSITVFNTRGNPIANIVTKWDGK